RGLLQADIGGIDVEDTGQRSQRNGARLVIDVGWIAGPNQADPKPGSRTKTIVPGLNAAVWGGGQIRSRRDRIETGSEGERKAGYRAVQIESRQRAHSRHRNAMRCAAESRHQ